MKETDVISTNIRKLILKTVWNFTLSLIWQKGIKNVVNLNSTRYHKLCKKNEWYKSNSFQYYF